MWVKPWHPHFSSHLQHFFPSKQCGHLPDEDAESTQWRDQSGWSEGIGCKVGKLAQSHCKHQINIRTHQHQNAISAELYRYERLTKMGKIKQNKMLFKTRHFMGFLFL